MSGIKVGFALCGRTIHQGMDISMLISDAEGAHLLLLNVLSSNFDVESEEYQDQVKKVVEVVKKAGEAAWGQKRVSRHETASRV